MRDPGNIQEIVLAMPDFIGFIFYPKSKRFVGAEFSAEVLKIVPEPVKKVGVFVDEPSNKVIVTCQQLGLEVTQLHGSESPEYCRQVQQSGLTVFKAFSVDDQFDFEKLNVYSGVCDYFLFDTKGNVPGGTGQKFNWQLLQNYRGDVPFFLSGGIGPEDVKAIRHFGHPRWCGLDINSGFEIEPALKDAAKVQKFIKEIRNIQC